MYMYMCVFMPFFVSRALVTFPPPHARNRHPERLSIDSCHDFHAARRAAFTASPCCSALLAACTESSSGTWCPGSRRSRAETNCTWEARGASPLVYQ